LFRFVAREVPVWGMRIAGLRTDELLLVVGFFLLGLSFLLGHLARSGIASRVALAAAVLTSGLSAGEWWALQPARGARILPAPMTAIEERYVEEGVGFRDRPGPGSWKWLAPSENEVGTRKDPAIIESERRQVEVFVDELGFANSRIPARADIITIGDSFTKGIEVAASDRWVDRVSDSTGLEIYNLGQGGFGPSQAVELYRRYGGRVEHWGVVLGIFGLNDVSDEENFAQFQESGHTVKGWAYVKAGQAYPRRSFGLLQLFPQTRVGGGEIIQIGGKIIPAPKKEIEPIEVSLGASTGRLGYHPDLGFRGYQLATQEPDTLPGVVALLGAIERLARQCRECRKELAVLYFPSKQSIHPPNSPNQPQWSDWLRLSIPSLRGPDCDAKALRDAGERVLRGDLVLESLVERKARQLGVAFLSLRAGLQRCNEETGELVYFCLDSHWNDRGHECVGRCVSQWLGALPGWSPRGAGIVAADSAS
jgi:hypothetical protein